MRLFRPSDPAAAALCGLVMFKLTHYPAARQLETNEKKPVIDSRFRPLGHNSGLPHQGKLPHRASNSHFGPSSCHIVMAGLVPAIHRGTVLRGWPEQVRP
jgi:hypothetical protein